MTKTQSIRRTTPQPAEKFPPVSELWFGADSSTPRNHSWSNGWGETWEYYEANVCDKCGVAVVNARDGDRHRDVDAETECDGYAGSCEGPMMNYFYPLPTYRGDPSDGAKALAHLPLCIVEFLGEDVCEDERYALALTGGGMNFCWEICEAFMRLGFLPPTHFAGQLPEMSGRGTSKRDRWIIAGCRRSLHGARRHIQSGLRRLRDVVGS